MSASYYNKAGVKQAPTLLSNKVNNEDIDGIRKKFSTLTIKKSSEVKGMKFLLTIY